MLKDRSPSLPKAVVTVGSFLCLLASWVILSVYMFFMTDGLLNPWDAAPPSALPLAGTLSRLLHDLFTTFPTAFLPALIVLGGSVGLFLKQLISTHKFVPLAWRFAALNVGLVGVDALATPFVWSLERRLLEAVGTPLDYGFHRHAVSLLFWLVLLLVWFWLQRATTSQRDAGKVGESS